MVTASAYEQTPTFEPYPAIPDFGQAIEFAKMSAQPKQAETVLEQRGIRSADTPEEYVAGDVAQYREQPDDFVIPHTEESLDYPHIVSTKNPDEYWTLFRQSLGLPLDTRGDEGVEDMAAREYLHEMEHAAWILAVRPDLEIGYTIGFYRGQIDGKDQYFAHPGLYPLGNISKVELAAMIAAPTIPSHDDRAALKDLGYSSVEEVQARYAAFKSSVDAKIAAAVHSL